MSATRNTASAPDKPSNQEDDIFIEMCRMVDNLLSEKEKPESIYPSCPRQSQEDENQPSDTESTESWTYYDYTDHRHYPSYEDNDSDIYDLMYECNHGEWGN
uniref:X protein n=1 Tax=Alphanucleorhabdovirus physostegiae TaxID=2734368 RepID=A0A8T9JC27_9RHAB|nr:X protein [Physostegia chlorotic mottle virus]UOF93466.1 X protein [Alphanucleorhabdovirus physostegiae]